MLQVLVFAGALFAFYIYLNSTGETLLEDYCNNTGYFSGVASLDAYDDIAKNMIAGTGMCSGTGTTGQCGCQMPSGATYTAKWRVHNNNSGTTTSGSITHNAAGVTKVQDCPTVWDALSSTAQAFVTLMG